MARPEKQGLDYFSFDVDFFSDEKIEAISGEFGIKGEITAIRLLCAVYRNGYFILWNEMLKMKLLKNLPGISPELLDQIVNRLIRWGFFDKTLFDSDMILTSHGIQKRYFEAVKRRKQDVKYPYLLVNVCNNEVNVNNNYPLSAINANINTQSKGKEIKEDNNNPPKAPPLDAENEFEKFRRVYPGVKRGLQTEFNNFKKKHKDWESIIPLLLPAVENEIGWHDMKKSRGEWAPEYKNLGTWINNRCWEQELETTRSKDTIIGDGEFTRDGRRYYGDPRGAKFAVPDNAPPRPSAFHGWSKELNDWVML